MAESTETTRGIGVQMPDSAARSESGSRTDGCWIGFDLGGTKMYAAVLDSTFRIIGRKRKKTEGHAGAEAGLGRIIQTIHKTIDEAEFHPDRINGIGVGCPGPLDLDNGIVLEAPNLGWRNVNVKAALEQEFGCPVAIANDVDAGVFGEYLFGAGRNARCVVGVFPGTGIGGGCVYEGRILRGKTRSCMEIGHIQVVPNGPLCGCGQHGCLEAVASRLAVAALAARAAYRGQAPKLLELAGTDLQNIRSAALAESIAAGDSVVEQIVREAAEYIGEAVAALIHLLAPDVVVLGGGMAEAMPELFVGVIGETARQRVMPGFRSLFEVRTAELGDDAAVMGAAAWVRKLVCGAAPSVADRT